MKIHTSQISMDALAEHKCLAEQYLVFLKKKNSDKALRNRKSRIGITHSVTSRSYFVVVSGRSDSS